MLRVPVGGLVGGFCSALSGVEERLGGRPRSHSRGLLQSRGPWWSLRPFVLAGCVAGLMRPGPVPFPAAHKWACASGSWLSYSHGRQCTHSSLVCLWVSCPLACSPDTLQDGASPRAGPVPDSSLDPGMGPGRSKPWFRVDQSQGTSS